jgi:hypothetical protein
MSLEPLRLDLQSSPIANRAMASVLLLYYHLLREGGITNDQTVYTNADDFDPFAYLTVEVTNELSDVDQVLLRQGAAIHLLCDLNDMVGEYESDYLKQPLVKKILAALAAAESAVIPEATAIAKEVVAGEHHMNYPELAASLANVYERYVVSRFRALVAQ